jgi:hypothetical protein
MLDRFLIARYVYTDLVIIEYNAWSIFLNQEK